MSTVLSDIDTIKKFGKLKYELQEVRRQRERERVATDIIEEVGSPEPRHPMVKNIEDSAKGDDKAKRYFWGHIRPERVVRYFSNWKKGELYNRVMRPALEAERKKMVGVEAAFNDFNERHEGLDIEEAVTKPYMLLEVEDRGQKVTVPLSLDNMMFIYANSLNPGNRAHLYGTGVDDGMITEVLAKLPAKYRAAVDDQVRYYDDVQWRRISPVFAREHNVDMPKENNYFPISNLRSERPDNALINDLVARHTARRVEPIVSRVQRRRAQVLRRPRARAHA